jgi:hypothetical protein
MLRSYFQKCSEREEMSMSHNDVDENRSNILRITIVSAVLIIYIISINIVGYFISTLLASFLILFWLGIRNWKLLILVPPLTLLVIYVFFEIGMKMRFPRGSIF